MDLAKGPLRKAVTFPVYFVNGYKFHTIDHGAQRATFNSGVCLKACNSSEIQTEYYGELIEIIQLEYPALPLKRTILFNCRWFDPILDSGTRVHLQYKLVDINKKRSYRKYDPFILASQAEQVYYVPYPTVRRQPNPWLAVCKIKARPIVQISQQTGHPSELRPNAFQEEMVGCHNTHVPNNDTTFLLAEDGEHIDLDDEEVHSDKSMSDGEYDDDTDADVEETESVLQ